MGRIKVLAANTLWACSCWKEALALRLGRQRVQAVQARLLRDIVRENRDTAFGREHRFAEIRSVADYQARVPLAGYDDYAGYIERIGAGEAGVLTAEPVLLFEPSSGSSAAAKLIPYTRGLQADFRRGIDAWVWHLFRWQPRLLFGPAYWSISPAAHAGQRTAAGLPIGFAEDSEYLGTARKRLVEALLVVPREVTQVRDVADFRYVTLLFLLRCRDLALVSVWNPTFLTLLLGPLPEWLPALARDLASGMIDAAIALDPAVRSGLQGRLRGDGRRSREVERVALEWAGRSPLERDGAGRTLYEALWPRLAVISCWADGRAAEWVGSLREAFPHAAVQPKGLTATEGFVSWPLGGLDGAVLALRSHFFEFIEAAQAGSSSPTAARGGGEEGGAVRLAHELQYGRRYAVVLTTHGGLYRYRLGDLVQVVGHYGQCPRIRFLGKEDLVVDLFGEKLNEAHVRASVEEALARQACTAPFWLVAPERAAAGACFYTLFVQPRPQDDAAAVALALRALAQEVEGRLRENYHYDYCRRLNQLGPLRAFWITAGTSQTVETYLAVCTSLGQRLGDIKAVALHGHTGWATAFQGHFV